MEGGLTKVGRWDFKGIRLSQSDVASIQVTQLQDTLWRERDERSGKRNIFGPAVSESIFLNQSVLSECLLQGAGFYDLLSAKRLPVG